MGGWLRWQMCVAVIDWFGWVRSENYLKGACNDIARNQFCLVLCTFLAHLHSVHLAMWVVAVADVSSGAFSVIDLLVWLWSGTSFFGLETNMSRL